MGAGSFVTNSQTLVTSVQIGMAKISAAHPIGATSAMSMIAYHTGNARVRSIETAAAPMKATAIISDAWKNPSGSTQIVSAACGDSVRSRFSYASAPAESTPATRP